MKRWIPSIVLLTLSMPALAALPPYYESVREFQAVLSSQDVAAKLGPARSIDSITRERDSFSVIAGDCQLTVGIEYIAPPPGFAGPAHFELKAGELTCLAVPRTR